MNDQGGIKTTLASLQNRTMKKVAVIMGGYSSEYAISIESGETVIEALAQSEYEVYKVLILKDRWVAVVDGQEYAIDKNDFSFIQNGVKIKFDVVFNAIHGTPGEDGLMQGYFDLIGLKHSSSGFFESALTFNKPKTNVVLEKVGVKIPKGIYHTENEEVNAERLKEELGFPMFIKPARSGSSYGVTRVNVVDEIEGAVVEARKEDSVVVAEAAVIGTEVGCGVARINGKVQVLAITEIVSKNAFFDYQAKYEGASDEITPARIDNVVEKEIREISVMVYEQLGLSGVVRVDYIIEGKSNKPVFIEVNTVPGLSGASIVPQQVAHCKMSLKEFFTLLLEESLNA
jgi:D-alanine-D-alanine ligase